MRTFYDTNDFSFTKVFADNWKTIRDEYNHVSKFMTQWYEKDLHNNNWDVFGLFEWPSGDSVDNHCRMCPTTTKLVKENIRRNGAIGFSRLHANSSISPHCGYNGEFLRMHLGLIVPDGDVGIRVGDDTYRWKNGEVVVFDDRIMHAAWNNTNQDRVVLIVDFIP